MIGPMAAGLIGERQTRRRLGIRSRDSKNWFLVIDRRVRVPVDVCRSPINTILSQIKINPVVASSHLFHIGHPPYLCSHCNHWPWKCQPHFLDRPSRKSLTRLF